MSLAQQVAYFLILWTYPLQVFVLKYGFYGRLVKGFTIPARGDHFLAVRR